MFTPAEYYKAWLLYLGGVALMMASWWYLTHFIRWREVRQLSRIIVAVLLLVPWFTEGTSGYLAPAALIAIVEALTIDLNAFWRAGTPLLIALILALVSSLSWYIWRWRQAQSSRENDVSESIE